MIQNMTANYKLVDRSQQYALVCELYALKTSLNERGWMELPNQINAEGEVEGRGGWNCPIRSTQRERWKGEVDGTSQSDQRRGRSGRERWMELPNQINAEGEVEGRGGWKESRTQTSFLTSSSVVAGVTSWLPGEPATIVTMYLGVESVCRSS
jgi:hypothetical protein